MSALVIYYSYSGNTAARRKRERKGDGAIWRRSRPSGPTPAAMTTWWIRDSGRWTAAFSRELRPLGADLSRYDTIILGTPVWWYTFAPAMNSFLHSADLSGKTVYPFATNGGWLGHTFRDFEKACRGAQVKAGLDIRFNGDRQMTPDTDIQKWLKNF